MTETKRKHTLEGLIEEIAGTTLEKKEQRIHAAMFLAFYGAVNSVVGREILTTPLFGISYDSTANKLGFDEFQGVALVSSKPGQYSVSSLDMIFACHARDMPLIFEGDTGVGKTITTEAYLQAILPSRSTVIMSLSHQSFTDSPKAPFERTEMVNGMPVTYLNWDNMRSIAALYCDELNLGNPNDLLQLSYGRVLASNERGIAGILIPKVTPNGIEFTEDYLKRLWLSGSQNPPKSRDAQFTGIELSASLKNRFLVVGYPKIVKSVGTTMWMVDHENGLHERFLQDFQQRYAALTGQVPDSVTMREDWLSLYAFILDSKKTEKAIIPSSLEFGDVLIEILSGELDQSHEMDKNIVQQCQEEFAASLPGTSLNFLLRDVLDPKTEEVKKINSIVGSFAKPLTERDDAYIKCLADLLATIKYVKRAYQDRTQSPLESFLRVPTYITVEEVAAAATLLARNKQVKTELDPLLVVNSVLKDYVGLMDELARPDKMNIRNYAGFKTDDANLGLKESIYTAALRDSHSVAEIVSKMSTFVGHLRSLVSGSDVRKVIVARTTADLAVTTRFLIEHQADLDAYLVGNKNADMKTLRSFIYGLYQSEKGNPTIEPVYTHRLPRVL
ncbi:MAG: hypothetical protein AABX04_02360 [Nanoarchaeota archaeon]